MVDSTEINPEKINRFNLRTYGILICNGQVLISKEHYQGRQLIKFPGGGVEFGEGMREALIREWQEEMSYDIKVEELFYVTDYFIQSAFIPEDQIISLYYIVTAKDEAFISVAEHRLEWMDLDPNHAEKMTFPQDGKVFRMACKSFNPGSLNS